MTTLRLSGLIKNINNDKEALAYLDYGDEKSCLDHKGKTIGADGEIPSDFIKHLNQVVVPYLKKAFKETIFLVGQTACDPGSAPYIVVNNTFNKDIDDEVLKTLKKLITTSITHFNMKRMEVHPYKLFKTQPIIKPRVHLESKSERKSSLRA